MRTRLMPIASVVLTIPKTAIDSEKRTGTRSDAKTSRSHNLQTNRRRLSVEAKDAVFWDRELAGFVVYDFILLI